MNLAFDIFQGIGIAAAVGVRPFVPALATGALAAGDIQIDFKHSDYHFLQQAPFLIVMAVGAVVVVLIERRVRRPADMLTAIAGLVLGALLFAGALARDHHPAWPGWIAGVACALVAVIATRPLLERVRARLADATTLALYAEGLALVVAVLSVVAPPVGVVALAGLGWLLLAGRRREDQKYAGLRILR
jgi:drug/metabolite transporter (DMT)-like permease